MNTIILWSLEEVTVCLGGGDDNGCCHSAHNDDDYMIYDYMILI